GGQRLRHGRLVAGAAAREGDARDEGDAEAPHARRSLRFHGTAKRSATVTSTKSATAISIRISTPAQTRGVSSWLIASSTMWPSPSSASAHSPNTAPITDTVAATRSPLKK